MLRKLKTLAAAVAVLLMPVMGQAATVSGQIDISGLVNLGSTSFTPTGGVDLTPTGIVLQATGDFASTVSPADRATLTDIDFTTPGDIWTVGGFTFTATSFPVIDNVGPTVGFEAVGIVSGNGFDDTTGMIAFTTQPQVGSVRVSFSSTTVVPVPAAGLMLITALGGVAALRRRKRAA